MKLKKYLLIILTRIFLCNVFPQGGSNTALAAVAFQDHMTRNLSLSDPLKKKQIHHGVPKKQLKEVKSVVDSGVRQGGTKKKEASSGAEREYVLDQKPQPMTLGKLLLNL